MAQSFLQSLYSSPEINPLNLKAKSIPILNPINRYGRVFFFSWFGFMVAFLSWYAFPPLMTLTIRKDLNMTQNQVANSNIVALLATFLVRVVCGPLCDRFGPRWVFIGTLICGAVPTAMAGLVTTPTGLIALRFFVGILGATFVPCQVWCTGFFDKNVVGSANALAGGFGNAGGGITYFVMPAIFDALVHQQGLSPSKAWRVSYLIPFSVIITVAVGMAIFCDDTPSGRWADRHEAIAQVVQEELRGNSSVISTSKTPIDTTRQSSLTDLSQTDFEKKGARVQVYEVPEEDFSDITQAKAEVVVEPTVREALAVVFSRETFALAAPYACSFGSELAINSILGAFYYQTFPDLGQTTSGRWAAMLGLLNVVFRPLGGFVGDVVYKYTKSVWAKKIWLVSVCISFSIFLLAIGFTDTKGKATLFGLVTGYAFFMAAANGANFAVVPHVHPFANGIVSGIVGAFGNLGGIVFAIVFRYNGTDYHRSIWIIGAVSMAVNVLVAWIAPIPKGQVGGR